jgi:dynein heavy chain
MDVHARDVAASLAADGDVPGCPGAFAWTSQLRTYWEGAEGPRAAAGGAPGGAAAGAGEGPRRSLVLRMMNASVDYGYEYLGNRWGAVARLKERWLLSGARLRASHL